MSKVQYSFKPLALAALLLGSAAAQASITVFTSESSFLAATTGAGTDSFDDLAVQSYAGPLSRTAGAHSYEVSAGPASNLLYGAGTGTDGWLSTNIATDSITFSNFGAGVYAAGAYFFNTDIAGEFLRRGNVTVTATDSSGSVSQIKYFPTTSNYFGFVSDTTLVSLTVTSAALSINVWPTVDDFSLAAAVPEPTSYAMLLAGMGVLGFVARRRRQG